MAHAAQIDITREHRRADDLVPAYVRGGLVVGGVGLVLSVILAFIVGWTPFFKAYLVNFTYFLSLALGALFFVFIQHLTRAGWSVAVRRIAEAITAPLPLLALLSLGVILGMNQLYPWTDPAAHPADQPLLEVKTPYLNQTFFVIRLVVFFVLWIWMARYFTTRSAAQDGSGDIELTRQMQRFSAPAAMIYAVTATLASMDLLMSLKPIWYSTIFGIYYFSGAVVGAMALLIVLCVGLQSAGRLKSVITAEHYHDMGKLMFAFIVFWAYIAFSQYMLIWYANLPETTAWYANRQTGNWVNVSLFLLFGHFVLPFLALISRVPKRQKLLLALGAAWMLLVHWFDLFYLVVPTGKPEVDLGLVFGTTFLGIGGLFVAVVARALGRHSLVPERDPRLIESVAFQNI